MLSRLFVFISRHSQLFGGYSRNYFRGGSDEQRERLDTVRVYFNISQQRRGPRTSTAPARRRWWARSWRRPAPSRTPGGCPRSSSSSSVSRKRAGGRLILPLTRLLRHMSARLLTYRSRAAQVFSEKTDLFHVRGVVCAHDAMLTGTAPQGGRTCLCPRYPNNRSGPGRHRIETAEIPERHESGRKDGNRRTRNYSRILAPGTTGL